MMLNESDISEFRRVSKLHEDWLVRSIVGPDLLTSGELSDLVQCGSLPLDPPLDLPLVSYLLGKKAAQLKADEYKSLNFEDLTSTLSALEEASIVALRVKAAEELRQISRYVTSSFQDKLHTEFRKSILDYTESGVGSPPWFERAANSALQKAFVIFQNIYSLATLDLIYMSKSQAHLNSIVQGEGIYTEGLDSQIMLERNGSLEPLTARQLMSKSLSGSVLHYVPPGSVYADGKIKIVNKAKFEEAISKSVAGVSGGISSSVKPEGPPQPKSVKNPGSISGVAAPGNKPGPGRGSGQAHATRPGVEYDDWKGAGESRPSGEGWEQSTTGGWRHIKGAGGVQAAGAQTADRSKELRANKQRAIQYGKTEHPAAEVLGHLRDGTLTTIKKLGQNEAGIHNAFLVTTAGGGRALLKPVEYQTMQTHGRFAGTGYGSVPRNNSHGHEVGAYQLHAMLGLNTVKPTTSRSFDGATHSVQAWAEDHLSSKIHTLQSEESSDITPKRNDVQILLDMAPPDKKEEFKDSIMGMVTMDVIMNNNDRHMDNLLVNKDSTATVPIDHSDCFGTGMKGIRNDFHSKMHQAGIKVTIPKPLQNSLRGKSLGDYKRALGGHLQDWQIGQTYLRAQYALHLQDTEGHLDHGKFLPTLDSFNGLNEYPMQVVRTSDDGNERFVLDPVWRTNNHLTDTAEFDSRVKNKTLPNNLFQSYAKHFINTHKDNPESPHHEAAKELDELGVFMPGAAMHDPKAYRSEEYHRGYEAFISAKLPVAQVGHTRNLAGPEGVDPVGATQVTRVERLKELGETGTIRDRRKRQDAPERAQGTVRLPTDRRGRGGRPGG